MKYIFTLLTLGLLLTTTQLQAQAFYGGVLGGYNASQVEGDRAKGFHKPGYLVGAWIQADISEHMFWGMELKVNQKGSRIRPTKQNDYWKYVYRLDYFDLPLLLGYKYDETFTFFAGVSAGYLFNAYGENNLGEDPTLEYGDIRSVDVSGLIGAKLNFSQVINRSWSERLSIDIRWQYSLIPIVEYPNATQWRYSGQFNNVLSFALYYELRLRS